MLFALVPRIGLSAIAGPAGAIVSAITAVFQALVAFFSTTFGKYVGLALIGLGLFVAGDIRRGHQDKAGYAALVASSEARAQERDAAIAKSVSADADARIAAIQASAAQLETQVADYDRILKSRQTGACALTADDLRRLRGLR